MEWRRLILVAAGTLLITFVVIAVVVGWYVGGQLETQDK